MSHSYPGVKSEVVNQSKSIPVVYNRKEEKSKISQAALLLIRELLYSE